MSKLYLSSGYADQEYMISAGNTFIFQVGARGTGKTYGALEYLLNHGIKFLYIRRTDTESKMVMSGLVNPFKALNTDVKVVRGKMLGTFMLHDYCIGYCAALSTFHNIRGMDFSDVEFIYFDEFIPEKAARPIKDEYKTLMNLYETVNRNRELQNMEPVKMLCSANSNTLDNPIFLGLEIVNKIAKMMNSGNEIYHDPDRMLTVYMLMKSPISEKKAQTALYKLTAGQEFQNMALKNMFDLDTTSIRPSKLIEYNPYAKCGELCVYKHKSRKEYYVNCAASGTFPRVYSTNDMDLVRFRTKHIIVFDAYIQNRVYFEDATSLYLFEKFYN